MTDKNLEEIIYVNWEESEADWGTRPDGCSLHLTTEDAEKFERAYWKTMPEEVPHEYERPAGAQVIAYVTSELYKKIKNTKYGLRVYDESEAVKKGELVYGKERNGWVSRLEEKK